MRRRAAAPSEASGLGMDALRPCPPDDLTAPYEQRVAVFEEWLAERDAWVTRREAYADTHGWPGGDYTRALEESEAHPIPDAPFDPYREMGRSNQG